MRDLLWEARWKLVVRFMDLALRRWLERSWYSEAEDLDEALETEMEKAEVPD